MIALALGLGIAASADAQAPAVEPAAGLATAPANRRSAWGRWAAGGLAVGLLGGAVWWARRRRDSAGGGQVTGRLPLGSARSVVSVEVAGQPVLLGVSTDRVQLLAVGAPPERTSRRSHDAGSADGEGPQTPPKREGDG